MVQDDEEARKARAERLREQIAYITNSKDDSGSDDSDEESSSQEDSGSQTSDESPRDFIHRRMRELDE